MVNDSPEALNRVNSGQGTQRGRPVAAVHHLLVGVGLGVAVHVPQGPGRLQLGLFHALDVLGDGVLFFVGDLFAAALEDRVDQLAAVGLLGGGG